MILSLCVAQPRLSRAAESPDKESKDKDEQRVPEVC
jgi:hypothetical protein